MPCKILVIGKSGQLASELQELLMDQDVPFLGRNEVDLFNYDRLERILNQNNFDAIINTSAYTLVDAAEEQQESAHNLNCVAVRNLAQYCKNNAKFLLHISTDFVFSGNAFSPYAENHVTEPSNFYGKTKLAGEMAIQSILPDSHLIIRTSWLYSSYGNNFLKTMLDLMSNREKLSIIDDNYGTPTSAEELAKVCLAALANNVKGTKHFSGEGIASWYDFASIIHRFGVQLSLFDTPCILQPISSKDYKQKANRPAFSVLRSSDELVAKTANHWSEDLFVTMEKIKKRR